jgi:HlyD family secretion protein
VRVARRVLIPAAAAALALAWLPSWLRPSLPLTSLRLSVVTAGPLDASIEASGLVVPALERVISSPLDARVLRILKRPGSHVARGEPVIQLDVSDALADLRRAENDLAVKDNEQEQTRLGYEKSLVDLDGRIRVKSLELESRLADLATRRQLAAKGLLSNEELRRSELAVQQAEVELAQLNGERANARSSTDVRLDGLALQRSTLARDVDERRRVLDLATTKSDRAGVLTWVVHEEGALVRRGDLLARIADLTAFRVDASISDLHAARLRIGLPAIVAIDGTALDGRVSEVFPTVENGTIRFTIALDQPDHRILRPNLRADVQVVTDRRPHTLKIARGPFADTAGPQRMFVVDGRHARRADVTLGVSSFNEIEVLTGLEEGDTVIVSDMRDYLHLETLILR